MLKNTRNTPFFDPTSSANRLWVIWGDFGQKVKNHRFRPSGSDFTRIEGYIDVVAHAQPIREAIFREKNSSWGPDRAQGGYLPRDVVRTTFKAALVGKTSEKPKKSQKKPKKYVFYTRTSKGPKKLQ